MDESEATAPGVEADTSNFPPPPYTEQLPQYLSEHAFNSNTPSGRHEHEDQTVHHPAEHRPQGPPPSDHNPYWLLTEFIEWSREERKNILYWILLEILALTFRGRNGKTLGTTPGTTTPSESDMSSLWTALLDTGAEGDEWEIWTTRSWPRTIEMCTLVRHLQNDLAQGRWPLLHPTEKLLVERMVLEPAHDLHLDLYFCLELMGRYSRGNGCSRPESTVLDFYAKSPRATDLGDAIASHSQIIYRMIAEEPVRRVLDDYVAAYKKENGLGELRMSEEFQREMFTTSKSSGWPLSKDFMNLADALRSLTTRSDLHDAFEPSRTKLRKKQERHANLSKTRTFSA